MIKNKMAQGLVPRNIEDAFGILDALVSDDEREKMGRESSERFVGLSHSGIGRWMRNNWGFWKEEGPLYEWFVGLGLRHADDMSGLVLRAYWRRHKGEELDIEGQVQFYIDYWEEMERRNNK